MNKYMYIAVYVPTYVLEGLVQIEYSSNLVLADALRG